MEKTETKYWCFSCEKEVAVKSIINNEEVELQCSYCFTTFLEEIESNQENLKQYKPAAKTTSIPNLTSTTHNNNRSNINNIFANSIIINNHNGIITSNIGNENPSYQQFLNHFNTNTMGLFGGLMNSDFIGNLINDIAFGSENSTQKPPAAKSVIDNLKKHIIKEEEIDKFKLLECAICKEDYAVGDEVNCLECGHYHHLECIILWLKKQNNCPVCRFEMKTDCPAYENKKSRQNQRGQGGQGGQGGQENQGNIGYIRSGGGFSYIN